VSHWISFRKSRQLLDRTRGARGLTLLTPVRKSRREFGYRDIGIRDIGGLEVEKVGTFQVPKQ
jgi:hypothetical protein